MAKVFRLASKDQTSTYDFLTGYLRPADRVTSDNGDGWVTETMTLVARTADANILDDIGTIDRIANYINRYWNNQTEWRSYWLEENATDEPAKRALIQSINVMPITEGRFTPQLGKTGMKYTIVIIRAAIWEKITGTNVLGSASTLGGQIACASFIGSLNGRIEEMDIYTAVGGANTTANTLWGGIRPTLYGTTDFKSLWELEKGSLLDTAALGSDSDNASPIGTTDNIVTWACSTSETTFSSISISQVRGSTDEDTRDYVGEYLVLCRAKLSAAEYVRLKMRYGYSGLTTYEGEGQTVYFNSTDWHLYEMGVISIPTYPRVGEDEPTNDYFERFQFRLRAMRPGASAVTISVDCLVLIPYTHSFKMTGSFSSTDAYLYGFSFPDGSQSSYVVDATEVPYKTMQFQTNNWVYPIEGGVFVLAAEDTTGQSIVADEDELAVALYYYPRYFSHADT